MINAKTKAAIQRIAQRILETFTAEYLRAFKSISIRDAKKARKKEKIEDSSNEEPKDLESTPDDPHRPRGKNKYKKDIVPELQVKINTWTTLDSDVDPYVAYVVEASIGDRSSSVYRRYNEFKNLNKKFGKKIPDLKSVFPTAKTFEGRKFEHEYLCDRKSKLQKFLDTITSNKDLHQDEALLKWLGLIPPEDPKFSEVFEVAFTNTKWRLWIWKHIPYDEEEEAISKLVIEEVKRELLYDIIAPVPNQPQLRAAAASTVYKGISAIVGPLVTVGWKAAKEAVDPLKPKVNDVVETSLEKLLDIEEELKKKLTDGIMTGLQPIVDQLEPLLKSLSKQSMDPAFTVLKELYPYWQRVFDQFDQILKTGDEKAADEIEKIVKDSRSEAESKVNDILKKSLESILGDLSKEVTIEAVSSVFSPLKKLIDLVNNLFDVFLNPIPHIQCIKVMCEHRIKLEGLSPSSDDFRDKVEDLLDYEESWLLWRRYWTYWDYRWKAWSIYYFAWGVPELSTVANVVRDHAFEYAILQKKWIKRWSFRFGDHLHEKAKKATTESWKGDISVAFADGYKEANEYFKKTSYHIFHSLILRFFYAAIGLKVEETLMKGMEPMLDELGKAIPAPMNEIIDLDTITRDSIKAALTNQITHIIDNSIVDPYIDSFHLLKF